MKLVVGASLALALGSAMLFSSDVIPIEHGDAVTTVAFLGSMAFILGTALRSDGTPVSPYFLFLLTTCLFVGGRFISFALGNPSPVFMDTGFQPIDMTHAEKMRLMAFVLPCLFAIHAGYIGARLFNPPLRPTAHKRFYETLWIPSLVLILIGFGVAAVGYWTDASVVFAEGYVALYETSVDPTGRMLTAGQYALLLGTGLSFATSKKGVQLAGVALYGLIQVGTLALGVRTGFLSVVLLAAWLFHTQVRPVKARYFVLIPFVLLLLVQVVSTYSARNDVAANLPSVSGKPVGEPDQWDRLRHFANGLTPVYLRHFAWSQGATLLSIHVATEVDDYPLPAYLQTFIPGFGAAANAAGYAISPDQLYFGQHMAKVWMPEQYAAGYGFGWALLSDMIVFGQKNIALATLFSVVLGAAFSWLFNVGTWHPLGLAIAVTIFPKVMVLPRAGLYSIFPYMLATLAIVACWWCVTFLLAGRRVH